MSISNVDLSALMVIIGILVAVTNVITEVLKKLTWDKVPTNILVIIISEILTIGAGIAYAQMNGIEILWYYVAAAIIVGIFVAYAAMFGFDKLREALEWNNNNQ